MLKGLSAKGLSAEGLSAKHIYLASFHVHDKHASAESLLSLDLLRKRLLPHALLTYDIRHSESRYHRDACTERCVPHERHGEQIGNTGSVRRRPQYFTCMSI